MSTAAKVPTLFCSGCRHGLLKSFAAVSGVRLPVHITQPSRISVIYSHSLNRLPIRAFAVTSIGREQGNPEEHTSPIEHPESSNQASNIVENASSTTTAVESVPWYLQVERPAITADPLAERQHIPDLPSNPPPILGPLLQQISIELGLDDLSLLDLRVLDPPPALGANLIMIIGTARSVKHLNVCGDRLCRWLRSNYKLSPVADGLLGRNELKLKLRRKARKAKLLKSVGAPTDDKPDDGIHTGWICVNIGTVEGGVMIEEEVDDPEFIGFNTGKRGAKIVVQMLTEEKRAELDLEGLWTSALNRQMKRKAAEKKAKEEEMMGLSRNIPSSSRYHLSKKPSTSSVSGRLSNPTHFAQTRGYNSFTKRFYSSGGLSLEPPESRQQELGLEYAGLDNLDVERRGIPGKVVIPGDNPSGTLQQHSDVLGHPIPLNSVECVEAPQELTALLRDLRSMPPEDARTALGEGLGDQESTPFLRKFYKSLTMLPKIERTEYQIGLICYAFEVRNFNYKRPALMHLFDQIRASLLPISNNMFRLVLKALLRISEESPHLKKDRLYNLSLANRVIEEMFYRRQNALNEEIFVMLLETTRFSGANQNPPDSTRMSVIRLLTVMQIYDISIISTEYRIRLLEVCRSVGAWFQFWKSWTFFTVNVEYPCDATLYAYLYDTVASENRTDMSMKVLRSQVSAMEEEVNNKIKISNNPNIARALLRNLKIVEPNIEHLANTLQKGQPQGEWIPIYNKCILVLSPREVPK
ncbi:MAG: ATPase synthesis protein 25 mitochondrial [Cirrosporium novae-zelandiae]|nr:MAG: ATPase synthesis protein 25 mitochondrial [Cirrosporium novae-zelandiae]